MTAKEGFVGFILPPRERRILVKAAKSRGMTISQFVRAAIRSTEGYCQADDRMNPSLFAK